MKINVPFSRHLRNVDENPHSFFPRFMPFLPIFTWIVVNMRRDLFLSAWHANCIDIDKPHTGCSLVWVQNTLLKNNVLLTTCTSSFEVCLNSWWPRISFYRIILYLFLYSIRIPYVVQGNRTSCINHLHQWKLLILMTGNW